MSPADEPTNFLYPFIDAEEDDPSALLADLAASAHAKASESLALRRSTLEANAELLAAAAASSSALASSVDRRNARLSDALAWAEAARSASSADGSSSSASMNGYRKLVGSSAGLMKRPPHPRD